MDNLKESHRTFHSFCFYPQARFDGQHDKEKPILVVRSHPITQLSWFFNGLLIFLLIIGFCLFFHSYLNFFELSFVIFFGLALLLSYFWLNFLIWYYNVGIITDERIIDIDFHPISYKEVSMTVLAKVEDVTSKTGGFLSSFFDFGNVFIQTAGTEINIEFFNIPYPAEVVQVINQLIEKIKNGGNYH
ncbi:MAG: hypothetical protein N2482_01095 [Patescibacteria group bacterium]|nr:hypothetical protein [Patescibacteria group bacterium]